MREKRRDSEWHHRVQVGGAPHDADVGKFGLRLARKMRSNPRTQRGRGFARLKHLEMCNIWRSEDAIPSLFSLVCVGIETGLLGHFASYVASKVDHSAYDIAGIGHSRWEINFAGVEGVGVHHPEEKTSIGRT
jgi:hypothetical protein